MGTRNKISVTIHRRGFKHPNRLHALPRHHSDRQAVADTERDPPSPTEDVRLMRDAMRLLGWERDPLRPLDEDRGDAERAGRVRPHSLDGRGRDAGPLCVPRRTSRFRPHLRARRERPQLWHRPRTDLLVDETRPRRGVGSRGVPAPSLVGAGGDPKMHPRGQSRDVVGEGAPVSRL